MDQKETQYYTRQVLLSEFGNEGQQKLTSANVLVIGAGGLGCPVIQYLTGAGVGHLGIVDGDEVEISNLHRQILYSMDSIGLNKANEAIKILQNKNPFIRFTAFPKRLNAQNVLDIFQYFDIVVDCSDNYETRFLVNDACVLLNKPLVYGSIYKFQGQVSVFNYLKGPTYRCLVPEYPLKESVTNCDESGVIGVLPGIIGILQANEVIKIITGIGEVLSKKVLVYDAKSLQFDFYSLSKNQDIDYSMILKGNQLDPCLYEQGCDLNKLSGISIDYESLLDLAINGDLVIIDVREIYEEPLFKAQDVIQIPLSGFENNLHLLPKDKNLVFACKSGLRSIQAIYLIQQSIKDQKLFNLKNGISEQFINLWINKK